MQFTFPKSLVGMRNIQPIFYQMGIYADDVVLVDDSKRKLQLAVTERVKTLKERGMWLNLTERRVMKIARTED